jgi:hypothetical protein
MKLVLTQLVSRSEDINQNFETLLQYVEKADGKIVGADLCVLPELIGASSSAEHYESWVRTLAKTLDCVVVGGSHHEQRGQTLVNCGVVATPAGDIIATRSSEAISSTLTASISYGRIDAHGASCSNPRRRPNAVRQALRSRCTPVCRVWRDQRRSR